MRALLIIASFLIVGIGCKSKVSNKEAIATFKDVDVAEAKAMISQNEDLVILDVRTPKEVAQGTIPNAMVIDYYDKDFDAKIGILDKSKSYLVYCKKGGRSSGASEKMIEAGFKNVSNLDGGYTAWSE